MAFDTETDKGLACLLTSPWAYAEPLTWEDCFDFLAGHKEWACWNMDYDGQAILKFLPTRVRNRIALTGEAAHGQYFFKYVPHKFLKVWVERRDGYSSAFTIYDLKQFHNCTLRRAAIRLGVQEKKSVPPGWYRAMRERLHDPRTRKKVLEYALGDAQTLQAIIDKTVESFALAGLKFERPFSNASFAERYFRNKFRYRRNREAERMARSAYHGGRIECLKCGYFSKAYHYDIHSAYPSIIANLIKPDGVWINDEMEVRSDAVYAFVDCRIHIPLSERIGIVPVRRRSGTIVYPLGRFRKTITLTEYRYLEARGWIDTVYRVCQHVWPSHTKPFAEIADIYQKRKEDPRADYALKIVMNSVYGKLAQVLDYLVRSHKVDHKTQFFDDRVWVKREKIKDHTSFVYAAEITSQIRMQLIEAVPPEYVISYSTDGIFTTHEVPIPTGKGLGEWSEVEVVKELIVVGSGVYTYKNADGDDIVRFRGFSPNIALGVMLYKAGNRHSLPMRVLRNTSLKQASKEGRGKALNVLESTTRFMDVNFDNKRQWPKRWTARELTARQFESKAWIYYPPITLARYR